MRSTSGAARRQVAWLVAFVVASGSAEAAVSLAAHRAG